jgi:FkbM family methyltransferase
MRSYSGNFEDVRLERIFAGQDRGFYIDVGAGDPSDHSVTKHLYDRGWAGINVEPNLELFRRLQESRPRDINLCVACSNVPQTLMLFETVGSVDGCSTVSRAAADDLAKTLGEVRPRRVEATTLARICEEHVTGPIDFMKIDVEAYEREVIEGCDFSRWRPRVLVVESTWPLTPREVHQTWEPMVLSFDYAFAVFDGLNRFYVRSDEAALIPLLEQPISPFDNYELDRYVRRLESQQADVNRLTAELEALTDRLRAAESDVANWRRAHESRMAGSVRASPAIVTRVRSLAKRLQRPR